MSSLYTNHLLEPSANLNHTYKNFKDLRMSDLRRLYVQTTGGVVTNQVELVEQVNSLTDFSQSKAGHGFF